MTVADVLDPFLSSLLDPAAKRPDAPLRLRFWDDSTWGGAVEGRRDEIVVRSPDALRGILWSPGELGVARAYVSGDIDFDGDVLEVFADLEDIAPSRWWSRPATLRAGLDAVRRLEAWHRPPPPPPEEARPRGLRHSKARDAEAVGHHYDVGNEFYRLVLGESMTYSAALPAGPDTPLDEAQAAKYDAICRALGLGERPGSRLVDVGCGWGSMAIHAATHYGARVLGVTISREQATLARRRVAEAGVGDLVTIELRDYRDLTGETFDAVSSIGMFEHVGRRNAGTYFDTLFALLRPEGRLLNRAITTVGSTRLAGRSFTNRYVFPDGELLDVGETIQLMERAGFECRDVEGFREQYEWTLRQWVANLQRHWDRAVELVGERRARVWLLYMAGSAVRFQQGALNLHQIVAVRPSPLGASGMAMAMARA